MSSATSAAIAAAITVGRPTVGVNNVTQLLWIDGFIPTSESVVAICSLVTTESRSLISVRYGVGSETLKESMTTRGLKFTFKYLFVVNLQFQAVVTRDCVPFQYIGCVLIEYIATCRLIKLSVAATIA